MDICGNPWKCMKIYENLLKSMKAKENLLKIYGHIYENRWTSMKFVKVHEYLWDIFVLKKIRWVTFYILRTETPHISVLQREISCLNRGHENRAFSGKYGHFIGACDKTRINAIRIQQQKAGYRHTRTADSPENS